MTRTRWQILCNTLALLWCVWWYCGGGGGYGLAHMTIAVAALAMARRQPLPGTARWVVWSGLLVLILCLAANVERLVPPDDLPDESRAIDRVVTGFYALGVTALLFRATAQSVTLVALGALPMAFLVMTRLEGSTQEVNRQALLFVWGFVAALVAADQAQRLSRLRSGEAPGVAVREIWRRLLLLLAIMGIAFGLRLPLEMAARQAQRTLSGLMVYSERHARRRLVDLNVALPPAAGFGRRTRAVALVEADAAVRPGYLREIVYIHYRRGRWEPLRPGTLLGDGRTDARQGKQATFKLRDDVAQPSPETWRMFLLAPQLPHNLLLPGNALSVACAGGPLFTEANGTFTVKGVLPESYRVWRLPGNGVTAWPLPGGFARDAYSEMPEALQESISAWAEEFGLNGPGLAAQEVVRQVETSFTRHFSYRLGVRLPGREEPLREFMRGREGACALFASAGAMLYRHCGIPARLVSGYVCTDWNPWLKRWVVRERDAHVWVEIWDDTSRRWLLSDPTPPDGRPTSWRSPGRIRWTLDYTSALLQRLVAALRDASFLELIAEAGAALFDFLLDLFWSLPGALALAGAALLIWWRRRQRQPRLSQEERLRHELTRAMLKLERRGVATHLRRRHWETWRDWLERIAPDLTPEQLVTLEALLEEYQHLRYSAHLDAMAARAWLARQGL